MNGKIAAFLCATLTLAWGCAGDAPTRDRGGPGGSEAAVYDTAGQPAPPASPQGRDTTVPSPVRDGRGVVLFLGTSLTAGYGVGEEAAFPALLQARMDSAGLPFRVVNAGLSGETAAGGLRRLDWSLQEPVDVLVLELGANDGLRGNDVEGTHRALDAILARTRERYAAAGLLVLGMEAPPNMGEAYTSRFRAMYPALAEEHGATLVPFLLEGVAGEAALNQPDGIHPTAEGQAILADHVWKALEPLLRARAQQR